MSVLNMGQDILLGGGVAPELVGHDHPRHILQATQQLAKEPPGGVGVAPALHQDLQHVPVLVDGAPQTVLIAAHADEHLVQMPLVARPGPAPLSVLANCRPKRKSHVRMVSQLTMTPHAARIVSTSRRLRLKQ